MIIDPPSVFAPLDEWEAFVAELERLLVQNPDDQLIAESLRAAQQTIFDKRAP